MLYVRTVHTVGHFYNGGWYKFEQINNSIQWLTYRQLGPLNWCLLVIMLHKMEPVQLKIYALDFLGSV
jgi:hypothetical protein